MKAGKTEYIDFDELLQKVQEWDKDGTTKALRGVYWTDDVPHIRFFLARHGYKTAQLEKFMGGLWSFIEITRT